MKPAIQFALSAHVIMKLSSFIIPPHLLLSLEPFLLCFPLNRKHIYILCEPLPVVIKYCGAALAESFTYNSKTNYRRQIKKPQETLK